MEGPFSAADSDTVGGATSGHGLGYIRSGLEHKLRGVPCTINRFPSSGSNGRKALKWTWKREEELEMRSKVVGFMGENARCVLGNHWNGNKPRSAYGYGRNSLCESG